jgi:hypothetical protein
MMAKKVERWSQGLPPLSESVPPGEWRPSGIRDMHAGANLPTPASGVRSAPELPNAASYVPPRPAFDSEPQLTRVTAPDAELLALTRHAKTPAARRGRKRLAFFWFVVGTATGGTAVWCTTRDVRADVDRARVWITDALHALHSQATGETSDAPAAAVPAPSAADAPSVNAASAPATQAPTAQPAAQPSSQDGVPTVDVGQLPHARGNDPSSSSPPLGAPTLTNAPGPR